MIYTDGVHLIGDTLEQLHAFAISIGLKREWFQNHARHPHYDLTTKRAARRAFEAGAIEVDTRTIVLLSKHARLNQQLQQSLKLAAMANSEGSVRYGRRDDDVSI